MESFDIFSLLVGVAAVAGAGMSLARLFRLPKNVTVTRKDTGKSVVINTRASWREGAKLTTLL